MIHIIGDSHSLTFEGAKGIKCHWMDAWTAHNLWKKIDILKSKIVNPADTYWFLFGEIDCRMHIYRKHMSLGKSIGRLIDDTVDNYIKAVSNFSDFEIGIMAVPPQGYQDNFYDFDFYASQKTRQQIADGFNFALENECHDAEIRFIDKRLKFVGSDNMATFPSALVIFGNGNNGIMRSYHYLKNNK